MRFFCTIALALSIIATGFAADLTGSWKVDVDRLVADLKAADDYLKASAEEKAQMDQGFAMMKGMMGTAMFTFDATSIVVGGAPGNAGEKAEIVKQVEADGVITITTKNKDGIEDTVSITMVDADHMKMEKKGEKQVLWFVRQPAGTAPAPTPVPAPDAAPAPAPIPVPPGE